MRALVGPKCGTQTSSFALETHLSIEYHSMHSFFHLEDFQHTHTEFCLELGFN
jgi:hypothetical protein